MKNGLTEYSFQTGNLAGQSVVVGSLACIHWSAAAMSAKSPALSQRTREGQGTRFLCAVRAWANSRKHGPAPEQKTVKDVPGQTVKYVMGLDSSLREGGPYQAFCDRKTGELCLRRKEKKLMEKLDYMHRNPVQRRLVTRPADWMWSSARHYAIGEGGFEIESPGQPVAVRNLARIRRSAGAMSAKSPASRKEREKGRAPAFWGVVKAGATPR